MVSQFVVVLARYTYGRNPGISFASSSGHNCQNLIVNPADNNTTDIYVGGDTGMYIATNTSYEYQNGKLNIQGELFCEFG